MASRPESMRSIIRGPPDRADGRRTRRTRFRSPGHSSGCAADFRFHRLGLRVYEFARWPEDDATSSPGRADRRCSGDSAPAIDAAARQSVVDHVRAAARGAGPVRPDVAVVLALAGPCRELHQPLRLGPVGGEVVLAAQPVVIDPRHVRHAGSRLDPALTGTDLWRFQAALGAARTVGDDQARLAALRQAVACYRGPLADGGDGATRPRTASASRPGAGARRPGGAG